MRRTGGTGDSSSISSSTSGNVGWVGLKLAQGFEAGKFGGVPDEEEEAPCMWSWLDPAPVVRAEGATGGEGATGAPGGTGNGNPSPWHTGARCPNL